MLYVFGRSAAVPRQGAGAMFAPAFRPMKIGQPDLRGCDRAPSLLAAGSFARRARKPRSRPRTRARSNTARKSTRSRRTASSATSGTPRAIPAMAASHFRCARPRSRPSSSPRWSNAAGRAPACLITISSPTRTSAATASRAPSSARTRRRWANPCSRARSTPSSNICSPRRSVAGPATYEDCVEFWGQDTRQCEPMKK